MARLEEEIKIPVGKYLVLLGLGVAGVAVYFLLRPPPPPPPKLAEVQEFKIGVG